MGDRRLKRDFYTGLAVAAGILLLMESCARIATTLRQDFSNARVEVAEPEPWAIYEPRLGWRLRPGFEGVYAGGPRRFDASGFLAVDSEQLADSSQYRVVFLGDSNTFGYGTSTETSFVEVVDSLLPDVAAINLGVPGYSSLQGRLLLEEHLPRLQPDLLVVSFNFNDRRYVVDRDSVDHPTHFERLYEASLRPGFDLRSTLERIHTVLAMRKLLRAVGLLPEPAPLVMSLSDAPPRVDERSYRDNLLQIARMAQKMGIPVMYLVLKDNPAESYHVREGVMHLRRGEHKQALAQLKLGVAGPSVFRPLAKLHLARALQATHGTPGEIDAALRHSIAGIGWEGEGVIRLDRDYNDIMREVAAATGSALIDATALQDEHWETFIDACHFDAEGHRLIGELIAERIAAHRAATR